MPVPVYNESQSVRIDLLNIENSGSTAMITFKVHYFDNTVRTVRTNVKNLGGYSWGSLPKPIQYADFVSKVYTGFLKADVRLIFVVAFTDGTVQLIQEKESSGACTRLLALCTSDRQTNPPVLPRYSRQKNTNRLQQERPRYTCPGSKKRCVI